jgi:hypothetical protein
VKAQMADLERMGGSLEERERDMRSRSLMSALYRLTGPAKLAAAEQHISTLLEGGGSALSDGHQLWPEPAGAWWVA